MKVKELIELLQAEDQSLEVKYEHPEEPPHEISGVSTQIEINPYCKDADTVVLVIS